MKLRPYQQYSYDEFFKSIIDYNHICIANYCGTGKTLIASTISKKYIQQNKQVIFITPRLPLIKQTMKSYNYIDAEIIQGQNKYDESKLFFIASLQTLHKREFIDLKPSLIIFDESHLHNGKAKEIVLKKFPHAKILSLTATPFDSDGQPFKFFDYIIKYKNMQYYIDEGYLSDVECYAPYIPDLSKVRITAGDYNEGDLDRELNTSSIVNDIVENTIEFLTDKKSLVFAITISHCQNLANEYKAKGLKVGIYHSKLKPIDKDKVLEQYRNNEIQMICSVLALAEGFDEPDVNALVIARPMRSLSLYKQIIGRGMRPFLNKVKCLILDCGNIIKELGYPTDEVIPRKKRKFKKDRCKICNTPTKEISRIVKKVDNKVITIIKHQCQNLHEYETESEINPPACEQCNYIFKNGCDFKEQDNQYIIYHVCPECNTEKVIRTLDKMSFDKFIKIESKTKSTLELIKQIQKYTLPENEESVKKFVNYIMNKIHKDNQHHVITNLYQTIAKTNDLDTLKQSIRKSLVDSCLKTNKYDNIGSELLGVCLSKTQDITNIISIYNSRAKKPMADRWLTSTLTKINQFIEKYPEHKQYITQSITTRCKNIMASNNKMASLYYFPEFLEKQINNIDNQENNQNNIDKTNLDVILLSKLFNKKFKN